MGRNPTQQPKAFNRTAVLYLLSRVGAFAASQHQRRVCPESSKTTMPLGNWGFYDVRKFKGRGRQKTVPSHGFHAGGGGGGV